MPRSSHRSHSARLRQTPVSARRAAAAELHGQEQSDGPALVTMAELAAMLLLIIVIPSAWFALLLWPRVRRWQQLRRRNLELESEHDELLRSIQERSLDILKKWRAPEDPS